MLGGEGVGPWGDAQEDVIVNKHSAVCAKDVAAQGDTSFRAKGELTWRTGFAKPHDITNDSDASDTGNDYNRGGATAITRMDPDAFECRVNVEFQGGNGVSTLMDVVEIHNYIGKGREVRSFVCALRDAGIVRSEVLYKTAFGGNGTIGEFFRNSVGA